ncbi:hypothetical protein ACA910_004977 [Epithemia clementina (nom. ined.)]
MVRGQQRRSNYAQVSASEDGGVNSNSTSSSNENAATVMAATGRTERTSRRFNRLAAGVTAIASDIDDLESQRRLQQQQESNDAPGPNSSSSAPLIDSSISGDGVTEASSLLLLDEEEDDDEKARRDDNDKLRNKSKKEKLTTTEIDHVVVDGDDDGRRITVVILDVAQKKFHVPVHPTASVSNLKLAGSKVHKVPPDRQRLIYRGKMLQDEDVLSDVGITSDRTIVHLFPKPRVVIKDNSNSNNRDAAGGGDRATSSTSNRNGADNEDDDEDDQGARVPTIVLDADEAERRSQILVLGSSDYLEAQNNVKLFSFMLLIISSIELMNLLAVALGVPQEDGTEGSLSPNADYTVTIDDDIFKPPDDTNFSSNSSWYNNSSSNYGGGAEIVETWEAANWVDLVISAMGVYVGILGLQATTHNTLRLAKSYLIGTVATGVAWMIFNFVMTYEIDEETEQHREGENESNNTNNDDFVVLTDGDLRWQAVSVMVLPGMVWSLCCLRAWQFQHLLMEAEQEAEERIRSEFATVVRAAGNSGTTHHNNDVTTTTTTTTISSTTTSNDEEEGGAVRVLSPNHDEELALQNESARIS